MVHGTFTIHAMGRRKLTLPIKFFTFLLSIYFIQLIGLSTKIGKFHSAFAVYGGCFFTALYLQFFALYWAMKRSNAK